MKQNQAVFAPHDVAFKQLLSEPEILRDFMQLHLPAHLQDICDLSTLRQEQGILDDEDSGAGFSDMLYAVDTTAGEAYILVRIEYQSPPDPRMAFRLMSCAVEVMQGHMNAGHEYLPLVIPVLIYAGKTKSYPRSMNWLDSFEHPQLAEQLYCRLPAAPDERNTWWM